MLKVIKHTRAILVLMVLLLACTASAQIEGTVDRQALYDDDDVRHYLVAFRFEGIHVDATAQTGSNEIPIDINLGDVFDRMFSGSFCLEARKKRWNFGAELSYTKQNRSDDVEFDGDNGSAAGFVYKTGRIDGFASYRFGKPETAVEVLGGFRYSDFIIEGNLMAGAEVAEKFDRSTLDPILGVRVTADVSKKLVFTAHGIAGGFGVSSERIYDVNLGFLYGLTRFTYISLHYRWIDQLYESGAGSENFRYEGSRQGVLFGIAFIM